jgi:hypothetical protein
MALGQPSIGYVAFLNDVEQDVVPVTSGHCVTLTYNLYFDDGGRLVSGKDAILEHPIPPMPLNQDGFREAFNALLENPEFMADGGTLAFGLRHGYPIEHRGLQHIHNVLKGSDAVVYKSTRALGFEPMLYMYYVKSFFTHEGIVTDKLVYNTFHEGDSVSICEYLQEEGGIPVCQDGGKISWGDPYGRYYDDDDLKNPEPMEWVTPITTYNRFEGVGQCNDAHHDGGVESWDGNACMVVRIGKVGDRLAYPTVAQIEKAYRGLW